jgi:hypothetical protein
MFILLWRGQRCFTSSLVLNFKERNATGGALIRGVKLYWQAQDPGRHWQGQDPGRHWQLRNP